VPPGEPAGLLVLHHGRGTDERDLIGLADVLDPERRLLVVSPRAPLTLSGWPGYHWYEVPRVGHPDPGTFAQAYAAAADLHDELWRESGLTPQQTVLGGFSMGARPPVAGLLAFSGFIPAVEGWQPQTSGREGTRAFIAHGRRDPVIEVGFSRRARDLLEGAGLAVDYREFAGGHGIDPTDISRAAAWLTRTLAGTPA
jgi:phospholipase/carboxylesterase